MLQTQHITTARQLWEAGDIGPCMLIEGELIRMTPAGGEHGRITARLLGRIIQHVDSNRLGVVFTSETGFRLTRDPDTVLGPDIGFVRAERAAQARTRGYVPIAPDLAVETTSPTDRPAAMRKKREQWLSAGVVLWWVDPPTQTLTLYHPGRDPQVLYPSDTLTGGQLLPGFSLPVGEIFAG